MNCKIKRALISVSNKDGILEFASNLNKLGVEIISTGGTYKFLVTHGIPVFEVATITGFPEILDGRVKTLHPKIHGAILAKRSEADHKAQLKRHAITAIDLVCINLYPFEATITNPQSTFDDAIENIDIGGPAMIRSSGKNYQDVVVLTSPNDYDMIINQLTESNDIDNVTRLKLAHTAFAHTAYYDSLISNYLAQQLPFQFPEQLTIPAQLLQTLRYGENSHQVAAFYKDSGNIDGLLASFTQLQGKELSFNNLADSDTAWECVRQYKTPACVIVKHANPCGVALGNNALTSYLKALASDPVSSFGGIIAFNVTVDKDVVVAMNNHFCEVIIAPLYTQEALAILHNKSNVRVLSINLTQQSNKFDVKRIGGGVLVQTVENKTLKVDELKVVSQKQPTSELLSDLEFAWSVARFVKSNAIVLVKDKQTIGIGAGQMSRIDSTKIAMTKAKEFGFTIKGSVAASDAFFPFRDNVDLLADNGVAAIIQPGGSIRDKEIFLAADEHHIVMLLTGYRTFRH
ncbi:MAG: bifunctional phosphoribosylaminoimidazolecarboxamide formyltransferase/IMP cyclohydrolase [Burkholderiales bacterium]|nr:bifunctional phosphoribosylaminoimidazolecarboxamide formyltransferase/IMP cyclohydrolase [Burkholderiales bacterium]